MVVQVIPRGWTATCVEHGTSDQWLTPTSCSTGTGTHLWHPYSSATSPSPVHEVESASGVRLQAAARRLDLVEVVDAMSSWWCAIHGYAVPELDAAVRDQLGRMSHVMFGGLTHEPAVELGRRLVELSGLPHVFLADSGSVSVEVAMKMAWQAQAGTGRTQVLHGPRRLPRRHLLADERVRPRGRDAQHVRRDRARARLRPRCLRRDDAGFDAWADRTSRTSSSSTPTRSRPSSSSRCSRAPAGCGRGPPAASTTSAGWPASTARW